MILQYKLQSFSLWMKGRMNGKSPSLYRFLALQPRCNLLQNLPLLLFPTILFLICRFKHNGGNFHIKLPVKRKLIPDDSVPEDLVQTQAYLRWERKGKQMYTPQQEKASNEYCFLNEPLKGFFVLILRIQLRFIFYFFVKEG